ncbi:MAG: hypothetical protein IJ131_02810 [Eggerthellaceae bacterium]|nr:hypothetical protein [Eggerthellaceae bacterium]
MARTRPFCEGGQFYCYSLGGATKEDERDIMAFEPVDPKGAGLVAYLQHLAFPDEKVVANYMRYGFERLPFDDEGLVHARLKPRYDAQCVFMYMAL